MGISDTAIEAINKVSKRLKIAAFVFGLGMIACLVGIALSFERWQAHFPVATVVFSLFAFICALGVFFFGWLDHSKKMMLSTHIHEEKMTLIKSGHIPVEYWVTKKETK